MDFSSYMCESMQEIVPKIMAKYGGDISMGDLGEIERIASEVGQAVAQQMVQECIENQEPKYAEARRKCHCGGQAKYLRRRPATIITRHGRVSYRRLYYGCANCGCGHYPLDERLGIRPGQMSHEVITLAGLFGIQDSFGTSSDLLARSTGLKLSPNSIRKASQLVGEQVIKLETALCERSLDLEAQRSQRRHAAPPQRLYGSMDGFQVCFKDSWHEMKAGVWWQVDTDGRTTHKHYYVDMQPAEKFGDLVWATGFEQQANLALELVFIADGAEWIWRIVDRHFPQAVQIVDWYHAAAYLPPIAQAAFSDTTQQRDWLERVKTDLWEGRLEQVLAACRAQLDPQRSDDPAQRALTYFTNNRHRLNYAYFRAQGYQIGSGTMESGCKQLGLERLKIAGARWSEEGARKVAKARAAYLSGQWNTVTATLDHVA